MPIALGPGVPAFTSWARHVLLLQRLDRVPVQLQFVGDVLDRRLPAAPAYAMGKALGIEEVVPQIVELLALHLP